MNELQVQGHLAVIFLIKKSSCIDLRFWSLLSSEKVDLLRSRSFCPWRLLFFSHVIVFFVGLLKIYFSFRKSTTVSLSLHHWVSCWSSIFLHFLFHVIWQSCDDLDFLSCPELLKLYLLSMQVDIRVVVVTAYGVIMALFLVLWQTFQVSIEPVTSVTEDRTQEDFCAKQTKLMLSPCDWLQLHYRSLQHEPKSKEVILLKKTIFLLLSSKSTHTFSLVVRTRWEVIAVWLFALSPVSVPDLIPSLSEDLPTFSTYTVETNLFIFSFWWWCKLLRSKFQRSTDTFLKHPSEGHPALSPDMFFSLSGRWTIHAFVLMRGSFWPGSIPRSLPIYFPLARNFDRKATDIRGKTYFVKSVEKFWGTCASRRECTSF